MIDDIEGQKPSQQRIVLDRYFRAFLKWSLKLPLEDKLVLARFIKAVQDAHTLGKVAPAPAPEPTMENGPIPALVLPGLGGDPAGGSFIKHQKSEAGVEYGVLDSMLPGGKPRGPAN